jgi:hippurate hydrolase
MKKWIIVTLAVWLFSLAWIPISNAQSHQALLEKRDQDYAYLFDLYQHLHRHPELSFHEEKTAARIAGELGEAGFEVTEKVGGFGVVGISVNTGARRTRSRSAFSGWGRWNLKP